MPTPTPAYEHPANGLSKHLSEEFRQQLLKTPHSLPLEAEIYRARLKELRDNWKYGFVVQWCYLFKGIIKLVDHFDVDSFEEELLQLNPPSFITRLKTQLVYYLSGIKISDSYLEENGEFEEAIKDLLVEYFLHKYATDEELESFQFFKLTLKEQIDIYYELIELANKKSESLRKLIDNKQIELLKPTSVLITNTRTKQEEYLILPDLRLYYKELTFKKLNIPRKKSELEAKLKTMSTEKFFQDAEPKVTVFTCLATNIYEYDSFINSQPRNSPLFKALKVYYDEITENDIKRRKQELSRQRQIKLQSLMVHRKRSSRLEEKEKRKAEEDEKEKLELEALRKEAALNRAAKRMKLRGDGQDTRESSAGFVSREERYKRKHTEADVDSVLASPRVETETPAPQAETPISAEISLEATAAATENLAPFKPKDVPGSTRAEQPPSEFVVQDAAQSPADVEDDRKAYVTTDSGPLIADQPVVGAEVVDVSLTDGATETTVQVAATTNLHSNDVIVAAADTPPLQPSSVEAINEAVSEVTKEHD